VYFHTKVVNSKLRTPHSTLRLRLTVRGAVQGVGFRPFVYRLAAELGLNGWVNNTPQGVVIEVEGEPARLDEFVIRLSADLPPPGRIVSLETQRLDPVGYTRFEIRASQHTGAATALVLPDIATCSDCRRELFDPSDRRYLYPFINCTHCGPRYSIILRLPYDRPNTTMQRFAMCPRCQAEYDDPASRRFHAQPNACPDCGPQVELWDADGNPVSESSLIIHPSSFIPHPSEHPPFIPPQAGGEKLSASTSPSPSSSSSSSSFISKCVELLAQGLIVAVKGLGGFHLMVDARDDEAVKRLRQRKRREAKPLAVMFPDIETVKMHCEVNPLEERLLTSPESPIVLVRHRESSDLAENIAPDNPYIGALLPYTPLHLILMLQLGFPVVATSGNLTDEPICTDEYEAVQRLKGIADYFLVHNRPIARYVDDSIARVILGGEQILRRARGYAPLPIRMRSAARCRLAAVGSDGLDSRLRGNDASASLALGGHLKNTIALSVGDDIFISHHIGDLETSEAVAAFERAVEDIPLLWQADIERLACDLHPDYVSTQFAEKSALPVVKVQHHYAHSLACLAENEIEPPALAVSWDGTGYGLDGTIWGGEFLHIEGKGFKRYAYLKPFPLPGGDQAVREPRRSALGLLYAMFGEAAFAMTNRPPVRAFDKNELHLIVQLLRKSLNSPLTSSVGRLFDAVASLVGLRQFSRYEGEGAMALEFAADARCRLAAVGSGLRHPPPLAGGSNGGRQYCCQSSVVDNQMSPASEKPGYIFDLVESIPINAAKAKYPAFTVDWTPVIEQIINDLKIYRPVAEISHCFHIALAEVIVKIAEQCRLENVLLTGGCFLNRLLTELSVEKLKKAGFKPYWHQRVPPGDGGIALGQIMTLINDDDGDGDADGDANSNPKSKF